MIPSLSVTKSEISIDVRYLLGRTPKVSEKRLIALIDEVLEREEITDETFRVETIELIKKDIEMNKTLNQKKLA